MTSTSTEFKTLVLNFLDLLGFGFSLYRRGVCDKRIKGVYKLDEACEKMGYTKTEAANMLNLSVRQFDRRVNKGFIPKGRKYQGFKSLYWDKDYIDKMSNIKNK